MNAPSIKQLALNKALAMLRAAGCEFAVRTPEGEVFGDLPIATEKKRGGWHKKHDFATEFGYIDQVKTMKQGDMLSWTVGPERARQFQSAVAGTAGRYLPKGGFMTTVTGEDKGTVEILRVD